MPEAAAVGGNSHAIKTVGAAISGATVDASPTAIYRGYIDVVDPAVGLQGWVIDIADPVRQIRLELTAGSRVLAECATDRPRDDVAGRCGCPAATPGFCFPAEALAGTRALGAADAATRITVRIAGTGFVLPCAHELPTVIELATAISRHGGAEALSLAADAAPARLPEDIVAAARILRGKAVALAETALRPVSENQCGTIEAVSLDPAGTVWIAGWIRKGHQLEFPAVVADRRKYPAAVFLTCYDRADLPEDTVGMFGAVKSEWRPAGAGHDVFLFFESGGRFYLRTADPLRIAAGEELLEFFERIRPACYGRRTGALQRMLAASHNWLPGTCRVAGFLVEAWVDRAVVLPGFGCFVEGWVFSPVKRVEQLLLKIGSVVLPADPGSLYFRPRPDLDSAFPSHPALTRRAGFVATFRGSVPSEELTDPVLKIAFADGTSTNHPIQPKAICRLGHSAMLDELLRFYPSLHVEPFFPAFASAVRDDIAASSGRLLPFAVAGAPNAIVLTVPEDRSDLFLLFEEAERRCAQTAAPPGLVFVAPRDSLRCEAVALFESLCSLDLLACSLFFVDDAAAILYQLPEILDLVGATSFVFVAAGLFLTPAGWQTMLDAPADAEAPLELYEIENRADEFAPGCQVVSAECFGWSARAAAAWLHSLPRFVDIAGTVPAGMRRVVPAAARRSRPRPARFLAAQIDRQRADQRVF